MIAPARARSALGVSQIRSGMCQIRSGHREHQKHIYSCSSLVNDPAPGEREQEKLCFFTYSENLRKSKFVCAGKREEHGAAARGRPPGWHPRVVFPRSPTGPPG